MAGRWGAYARRGLVLALASIAVVLPATASASLIHVGATVELGNALSLGGLLPAGDTTCKACASFVTTFDKDGNAGPAKPVTTMHRNLVVSPVGAAPVVYALDVDTGLPALPIGLLPVGAVYDVSVSVVASSAAEPTITIRRLAGAQTPMPLRIEILSGDIATNTAPKTSFGYDTLDSTAPGSFVAAIDLTDRDDDENTSNVFVDMHIGGAALAGLTVVKETFTGPADGTRTDRDISRLTYRGDPAKNLRVPQNPTIEVVSKLRSTRTILTREPSGPTALDIELVKPNGGSRTTGTLDVMASKVDLTTASISVTRVQPPVASIVYRASAVTDGELTVSEPDASSHFKVEDLPTNVDLTYFKSLGVIMDPDDDPTTVTYKATDQAGNPARAAHVQFRRTDGERVLTASIDKPPATVEKLRYQPQTDGAEVVYKADGESDGAVINIAEGVKRTHAELTTVPSEIELEFASGESGASVHYVANTIATRAALEITDEKGQVLEIDLDRFPAVLDFSYVKTDRVSPLVRGLRMTYRASSVVPRAQIDASNLKGDSDSPKKLHLTLGDVPVNLDFDVTKSVEVKQYEVALPPPPSATCKLPKPPPGCLTTQYDTVTETTEDLNVLVDTPEITGRPPVGTLGSADFRMTNGPDHSLPATAPNGNALDGILLRDLPGDKSIVARVSQLDTLQVNRHSFKEFRDGEGANRYTETDKKTHVVLNSTAVDHALSLDLAQTSGASTVTTKALLASLPKHIKLDLTDFKSRSDFLDKSVVDYVADHQVDGYVVNGEKKPAFSYQETTKIAGGAEIPTKTAAIDPMPGQLLTCQAAGTANCSQGLFDANIAAIRAGLWETLRCFANGCLSGLGIPIEPNVPNNGSVRIDVLEVSRPIDLFYETRPANEFSPAYTLVDLHDLYRFGLQGDKTAYECQVGFQMCERGYLGLYMNGYGLIEKVEADGGKTRFKMPPGFESNAHLWAFDITGNLAITDTGALVTVGRPITCPEGTKIEAGGETLTNRFCRGDLIE